MEDDKKQVQFEHIKPQVPGILLDHTGIDKSPALRNEELFYRAIGR